MSRFGSIHEFRTALNSLVNGGSALVPLSAKKNSGSRARRNMAWPKMVMTPDGTSIPAENAQELKELLGVFPGSRVADVGGVVSPSASPAAAPVTRDFPRSVGGWGFRDEDVQVRSPREKKPTPRKKFTGELKEPNAPLSFDQARLIGRSVGGMAAVCPGAVTPPDVKGPSFHDVLSAHVTKGQAQQIIDAMTTAGVARFHLGIKLSPAQSQHALAILMDVAQISCPLPARKNIQLDHVGHFTGRRNGRSR